MGVLNNQLIGGECKTVTSANRLDEVDFARVLVGKPLPRKGYYTVEYGDPDFNVLVPRAHRMQVLHHATVSGLDILYSVFDSYAVPLMSVLIKFQDADREAHLNALARFHHYLSVRTRSR